MSGLKKWFAIMAIALAVTLFVGCSPGNDSNVLTLEKFEQIQIGMSYEEVVRIIGFEVSPMAEMGEKGTEFHTISYHYHERNHVRGTNGANAIFMFQGGRLSSKSQTWLR